MFVRKIIPVWAVLLCAWVTALPASAQEPTEEQLESARIRLQQGLEAGGLPPAAFETDPVPDWAVPDHEPKVLQAPVTAAKPTERSNTDVVDPNILSSQEKAEKAQKEEPTAKQKRKPKKPAVARKKEAPKLKTGRAAAGGEKKKNDAPKTPSAPTLVLPETLRP